MHAPVLLFLSNLFSGDMIIIVLVALVLFGGDKLPQIARGLGKGIRDFKEASENVKREINAQINSFEEKKAEDEAAAKYRTEQESGTNRSQVLNTVPVNDSYTPAQEENTTEHENEGVAIPHEEKPVDKIVEKNDKPVV